MEEAHNGHLDPASSPSGEILFRIGDVFPAEDELAVGLISLAQAMNDLVRVNGWLLGVEQRFADSPSERMYLFRLTLAHFHEARETLKQIRKLDSADILFGSLSSNGTQDLGTLLHMNSVWPDWFQRSVMYLRNRTFHYGGTWGWEDESWALAQAADVESGISWRGSTIGDLRLDFAEEVSVQHIMKHFPETGKAELGYYDTEDDLVEERLAEIMGALAMATGAAMRVIQELVAKYIASNSGLGRT